MTSQCWTRMCPSDQYVHCSKKGSGLKATVWELGDPRKCWQLKTADSTAGSQDNFFFFIKGGLEGTSWYSPHRSGHWSNWNPKIRASRIPMGSNLLAGRPWQQESLVWVRLIPTYAMNIIPERSNYAEGGTISIEKESRHWEQNTS